MKGECIICALSGVWYLFENVFHFLNMMCNSQVVCTGALNLLWTSRLDDRNSYYAARQHKGTVVYSWFGDLSAIVARNEESHFQGLLLIESGITETGVVERQIRIAQILTTSSTFSDRFACQLKMHATKITAFFLVYCQRLLQFR